jgi:hypothetical protein
LDAQNPVIRTTTDILLMACAAVLAFVGGCGQKPATVCDLGQGPSKVVEGRYLLLREVHELAARGQPLVDGYSQIEPNRLAKLTPADIIFTGVSADGREEVGGFFLSYKLANSSWDFTVLYRSNCSTEVSWGRDH